MPRVEIFHNVSGDAGFGLNTVFDTTPGRPAKRLAETPGERHMLVKVFEYDVPAEDAWVVLQWAFDTFNIGSGELAARYRARRLRSLSVGDVVRIDGNPYSCESVGWDVVSHDDLRIVDGAEAEKIIRDRFGFRPTEPLAVTVPLA